MKQLAQRPHDGQILDRDVPAPALRPGWILGTNRYSLIGAGTERSKIGRGERCFGRLTATLAVSSDLGEAA